MSQTPRAYEDFAEHICEITPLPPLPSDFPIGTAPGVIVLAPKITHEMSYAEYLKLLETEAELARLTDELVLVLLEQDEQKRFIWAKEIGKNIGDMLLPVMIRGDIPRNPLNG